MQRKTQKSYTYDGLGFPVILLNAAMVKVRGAWVPDVDLNAIRDSVFKVMAAKPVRLTGNEIRFVRHHVRMTLEEFARRLDVTHQAVMKWEKCGDDATNMAWSTEKDMRLFVLRKSKAKPKEFMDAYAELERAPSARRRRIKYDVEAATAW